MRKHGTAASPLDEFLESAMAAARQMREAGVSAKPSKPALPVKEAKLSDEFQVRGFAPQGK